MLSSYHFPPASTRQVHTSTYLLERNHRRLSLKLFGYFLARTPARMRPGQPGPRTPDPGARAVNPGKDAALSMGCPGKAGPQPARIVSRRRPRNLSRAASMRSATLRCYSQLFGYHFQLVIKANPSLLPKSSPFRKAANQIDKPP